MTAKALLCYSVGLWAIAGSRIVVPAFYSLQDTWTPLKIALICLGANVVLNAILIFPLKHAGLALATSLSSILNLILLFRELRPRLEGMDLKKSGRSLLQVAFSSLLMGLAAYVICSSGDWSLSGHTGEKMLLLGSGIGAGILIYIGSSYGMKNQELLFLMRMLRRKR
jgi:putative peptidoglycan lipid II flippase